MEELEEIPLTMASWRSKSAMILLQDKPLNSPLTVTLDVIRDSPEIIDFPGFMEDLDALSWESEADCDFIRDSHPDGEKEEIESAAQCNHSIKVYGEEDHGKEQVESTTRSILEKCQVVQLNFIPSKSSSSKKKRVKSKQDDQQASRSFAIQVSEEDLEYDYFVVHVKE